LARIWPQYATIPRRVDKPAISMLVGILRGTHKICRGEFISFFCLLSFFQNQADCGKNPCV
jgi:hypothetical protein